MAVGGVLVLVSSDGKKFSVAKDVAVRSSAVLREMVEVCGDEGGEEEVPLPALHSLQLEQVVAWMEGEGAAPPLAALGEGVMFELMLAATFLDMDSLLDALATVVAAGLEGRTAAKIRGERGVRGDLSRAQVQAIRGQVEWEAVENTPV